jgi:cytoskeleton protein RodZ
MAEIGATLREARMRARIDVSEIEAQTKIRAKYLRALENEEWGLLPGPTFVKSFLRTYAQALGLDGKALVEEYRLAHEHPSEAMLEPIVSTPQSRRTGRTQGRSQPRAGAGQRPSRGYMVAVGVIGVVIVVLIVLLLAGGSSPSKPPAAARATAPSARSRSKHRAEGTPARRRAVSPNALVSLSLKANALVYVCLIGDDGRKVIPGADLQPGETTPTYHARRFVMTLGNSSVTMIIDGVPRTVAPSSQAIGYSLTKATGRRTLAAGQLPTCT